MLASEAQAIMQRDAMLVYELQAEDSCEVIQFWTRGHVDKAAFVEALRNQHALTTTVDCVEHLYHHFYPLKNQWVGLTVVKAESGRGHKPVTCVEAEDCH